MSRLVQTFRLLALCLVPLLNPALALAQGSGGRYALDRTAVVAALQRAGITVLPSQVDLPAAVTSAAAQPELRVTAADQLPDARLRVRLTCSGKSLCTPFFAFVTPRDVQEASLELAALHLAARPAILLADHSPSLQAGKRTTLVMEDDRMHIELPVIAIDSGAVGTEVRVSSLDRKTTFRGVVAKGPIVKGSLP